MVVDCSGVGPRIICLDNPKAGSGEAEADPSHTATQFDRCVLGFGKRDLPGGAGADRGSGCHPIPFAQASFRAFRSFFRGCNGVVRSGGFLHGNHQAFAEVGQPFLQPADFRGVAGIEHSEHLAFLDTHRNGESVDGQPFFA